MEAKMGCKYVKEFDFGTKGKDGSVKYAMGGKVTGYAKGGACYAEGGSVKADMKQDKAMVKAAVHKHEKALHKGEPLTKLARGGKVEAPGFVGQTMIKDTSSLGIKGNKNPGIKGSKPVAPDLPTLKLAKGGMAKMPRMEAMDKREMAMTPTMRREASMMSRKVEAPSRKMVPVAPREPMLAMKTGGKVSQAKVGKVMGEFKSGDLHSGKNGPVVTKPKQAIAIALSEGRKAAKR
jgi:hypothetical protein